MLPKNSFSWVHYRATWIEPIFFPNISYSQSCIPDLLVSRCHVQYVPLNQTVCGPMCWCSSWNIQPYLRQQMDGIYLNKGPPSPLHHPVTLLRVLCVEDIFFFFVFFIALENDPNWLWLFIYTHKHTLFYLVVRHIVAIDKWTPLA